MGVWIVLGVAALAVGSLYGAGKLVPMGLRRRKWRKLVENASLEKTGNVDGGTVAVQGTAIPPEEEAMTAPVSGNDCLYAEWWMEEYRKQRDQMSQWVEVGSGELTHSLLVEDDAGQLRIEPGDRTDFDVNRSPRARTYDTDESLPRHTRNFMASPDTPGYREQNHRNDIVPGPEIERRRYHERTLEPGDTVYAYGTVDTVDGEARMVDPEFVSDSSADQLLKRYDPAVVKLYVALGVLLLGVAMWSVAWLVTGGDVLGPI